MKVYLFFSLMVDAEHIREIFTLSYSKY